MLGRLRERRDDHARNMLIRRKRHVADSKNAKQIEMALLFVRVQPINRRSAL